jgi:hypothetical protein
VLATGGLIRPAKLPVAARVESIDALIERRVDGAGRPFLRPVGLVKSSGLSQWANLQDSAIFAAREK